jgi:hypothetical protein
MYDYLLKTKEFFIRKILLIGIKIKVWYIIIKYNEQSFVIQYNF